MNVLVMAIVSLCISIHDANASTDVIDQLQLGDQYQQCRNSTQASTDEHRCLIEAIQYWTSKFNQEIDRGVKHCTNDGENMQCVDAIVAVKINFIQLLNQLELYALTVIELSPDKSQIGLAQILTNSAILSKSCTEHLKYVNDIVQSRID